MADSHGVHGFAPGALFGLPGERGSAYSSCGGLLACGGGARRGSRGGRGKAPPVACSRKSRLAAGGTSSMRSPSGPSGLGRGSRRLGSTRLPCSSMK
jgi:hypothetical protein